MARSFQMDGMANKRRRNGTNNNTSNSINLFNFHMVGGRNEESNDGQ